MLEKQRPSHFMTVPEQNNVDVPTQYRMDIPPSQYRSQHPSLQYESPWLNSANTTDIERLINKFTEDSHINEKGEVVK